MREGKVYLKDYEDEIEVFRDKQSGLKVICISHFPTTEEGMKAQYFVEKTGSHNVHEKIQEYEAEQYAIQNAQVLRTPSAEHRGDGRMIQAPTLVAHMQQPASSKRLKEMTDCTGELHRDMDPIELGDQILEGLFEDEDAKALEKNKKPHNFLTYYGPEHLRRELKVRANCKYWPWDTKVGFPDYMSKYRKTTLARVEKEDGVADGESTWVVVEDRVDANHKTDYWDFPECGEDGYEKMVIFLQPPREVTDGTVYISRMCDQDLDDKYDLRSNRSSVATVSRKHRKLINEGIDKINHQDRATLTCLKATGRLMTGFKRLMCLLPCLMEVGENIQMDNEMMHTGQATTRVNDTDADTIITCADLQCEPTHSFFQSLERAAYEG